MTMVTAGFKRPYGILAALMLACLPAAALAQETLAQKILPKDKSMPVMAGGEADFDACGSQGLVRDLNLQSSDGFLAVRAGPGSGYAMRDKVYNGYVLHVCDERGPWLGVVYSHKTEDCGVGTPWPQARAYTGPCRVGWVFRKYVKDYAG